MNIKGKQAHKTLSSPSPLKKGQKPRTWQESFPPSYAAAQRTFFVIVCVKLFSHLSCSQTGIETSIKILLVFAPSNACLPQPVTVAVTLTKSKFGGGKHIGQMYELNVVLLDSFITAMSWSYVVGSKSACWTIWATVKSSARVSSLLDRSYSPKRTNMFAARRLFFFK